MYKNATNAKKNKSQSEAYFLYIYICPTLNFEAMNHFNKIVLISLFTLFSVFLFSQEKSNLKLIKANSMMVDIRIDSILYKQAGTIDVSVNPDILDCSRDTKKVTFYTDVDSISFDITPDGIYDFGFLVNEKDTAWARIKATVPNYLNRLKNAGEYNFNDNREIGDWQYMDKNDSNLKALRTEFNLDSIAGNGDEMSRILNLMYWLHKLVRHDGNSDNPESRNAHDIIEVCKNENRGVNCRMLAITLNECYLAMGFKSRYVTCMPKELKYDDCHVINAVYSQDLDKWVWIDPTNAGFVKDENGVFLSIQEVRDRLVNGEPVFANENLNWNGKPVNREYYLKTYMAKNLYRMSSPTNSAYNIETEKNGDKQNYNELLPLDGINQDMTIRDGGINYKTNNPNLFWEKP